MTTTNNGNENYTIEQEKLMEEERGWLLDLYPNEKGEMVVWVKKDDGRVVRLTDEWRDCIYVHARKKADLEYLVSREDVREFVYSYDYAEKFIEATDYHKTQVLRLFLKDSSKKEKLAKIVQGNSEYGIFQIYNADVLAEQTYFFENRIFPFAHVKVEKINGEKNLNWQALDSRRDFDYKIPRLRKVRLFLDVERNEGGKKIPSFDDPLASIRIEIGEGSGGIDGYEFGIESIVIIDSGSELEKLLELTRVIREIDPDLIYTEDGDSFTFPYLAKRAEENGILGEFNLSREEVAATTTSATKRKGITYFSYGKILFRPPTHKLLGRIHIDESNTFVFEESGLDGAVEVARVCMIPMHTSLRASIGKSLSSLQFYEAWRRGILIPWKATMAEEFKTAYDMFVGDRGGVVYEPKIGVHENVGEVDFSSLYPSIMHKKNISSETVNCLCCKDSKLRVPELDYNICENRTGIIPSALGILLEKRLGYKEKKKEEKDKQLLKVYDARQNALKWILVASFGYLSFRHAKFGRIDAHMAVCAYARKTLIDAARVAESFGYRVIHAIVDSLWLKKEKATDEDYKELCTEIERVTGFKVSFEGIYKWVAFLESRMYDKIPVLNRYFGVFRKGDDNDSKIKVRGIEARRRDTPQIVSACQGKVLLEMAKAEDVKSLKEDIMPNVFEIVGNYAIRIRKREVTKDDLAILKRLSKNVDEYSSQVAQSIAAGQLVKEGASIRAGQSVKYIITDYDSEVPKRRVRPYGLFSDDVDTYDVGRYLDLLAEGVITILSPFGYDEEFIRGMVHNYGYQMQLGKI
jgi:DNA polymerase-2